MASIPYKILFRVLCGCVDWLGRQLVRLAHLIREISREDDTRIFLFDREVLHSDPDGLNLQVKYVYLTEYEI